MEMNGSQVRDQIILKTLQEELIGPCIYGESFDWQSGSVKKSQLNTPLQSSPDNEEILKVYPLQRYGIGVIYPIENSLDNTDDNDEVQEDFSYDSEDDPNVSQALSKQVRINNSEGNNDFDISLTNARSPSSIGLSFLVDFDKAKFIKFNVTGAFYKDFTVKTDEGHSFNWWKREPVNFNFKIKADFKKSFFKIALKKYVAEPRFANFFIEGIIRKYHGQSIVTAAIVNRNQIAQSSSSTGRFQGS